MSTKVQSKIWRCPLCNAGIKAPSRVRRNDARRYCLDCTKDTGKLVERYCVVRKSKEERHKDRLATAVERAKKKAEEEIQKFPWVFYTEFPKLLKLKAWGVNGRKNLKDFMLTVRRGQSFHHLFMIILGPDKKEMDIKDGRGEEPHLMMRYMLEKLYEHQRTKPFDDPIKFYDAVRELTGVDTKTKEEADVALKQRYQWEISELKKFPTPVRRRRKKRSAITKKSKVQKAIDKRKKKAKW